MGSIATLRNNIVLTCSLAINIMIHETVTSSGIKNKDKEKTPTY